MLWRPRRFSVPSRRATSSSRRSTATPIVHSHAKLFAAMAVAGPESAAVYLCTWGDRDRGWAQGEVAKVRATTPKERALLAKLKAMIARCYAYDAND